MGNPQPTEGLTVPTRPITTATAKRHRRLETLIAVQGWGDTGSQRSGSPPAPNRVQQQLFEPLGVVEEAPLDEQWSPSVNATCQVRMAGTTVVGVTNDGVVTRAAVGSCRGHTKVLGAKRVRKFMLTVRATERIFVERAVTTLGFVAQQEISVCESNRQQCSSVDGTIQPSNASNFLTGLTTTWGTTCGRR